MNRCISLDMRRSFGNARAKVDEKIVLPRLTDVTTMLQNMWKPRGGHKGRRGEEEEDDFEFYLIDLEDAFCHFLVRREKFRHFVTLDEFDQDACMGLVCNFVRLLGSSSHNGMPVGSIGETVAKRLGRDTAPAARG